MAVIPAVITSIGQGNNACKLAVWTNVTSLTSDTCQAVSLPDYPDRSIHVWGTFGGCSVAVNGSNNGGVSFVALRDPTSTTIAITSETIKAILENTQQIQPVATGGSSQTISIAILFHLSQALRA